MLNYEFPPLGGGGGIAAKKIAEGFVDLGHKVDYVTSYHSQLSQFEKVDGINVYRVRVFRKRKNTASIKSMLMYPVSGLKKCVELCLRNDYDSINTHFAVPSGPLGVVVSSMFGIKNILSIHGGDIFDPTKNNSPHRKEYLRKAVELSINNSDFVVAQSTNTRNNANKYYNLSKDIEIIPLPYEPYSFERKSRKKLNLEDNKNYLVSVGRLVQRKGYKYLIEALPKIENEDTELMIIGSGPQEKELKKKSKELGVSDKVNFLGYLSEEKKFQYLANSDIYVLSSIHEGFGIVLQEAMQVGLPIIATNRGGQKDLIEDGKNGILIPPKEPETIADSVESLLSRPEKMKEMKKNNLKKVQSFSSKEICKRYLELV